MVLPSNIAPLLLDPPNPGNLHYDRPDKTFPRTPQQPIGDLPSPGSDSNFQFPSGEEVKPYSGLPPEYRDRLLSFLMPQLEQGITNLPQNIDAYTENALQTYRTELDRTLKESLPRIVGNLANRGILDSSVAGQTLSQTARDAALRSAGMGYQTALEAAKLKTAIPQTIGQLLGYGQFSEDPTVMYRTIADLLRSMAP